MDKHFKYLCMATLLIGSGCQTQGGAQQNRVAVNITPDTLSKYSALCKNSRGDILPQVQNRMVTRSMRRIDRFGAERPNLSPQLASSERIILAELGALTTQDLDYCVDMYEASGDSARDLAKAAQAAQEAQEAQAAKIAEEIRRKEEEHHRWVNSPEGRAETARKEEEAARRAEAQARAQEAANKLNSDCTNAITARIESHSGVSVHSISKIRDDQYGKNQAMTFNVVIKDDNTFGGKIDQMFVSCEYSGSSLIDIHYLNK